MKSIMILILLCTATHYALACEEALTSLYSVRRELVNNYGAQQDFGAEEDSFDFYDLSERIPLRARVLSAFVNLRSSRSNDSCSGNYYRPQKVIRGKVSFVNTKHEICTAKFFTYSARVRIKRLRCR